MAEPSVVVDSVFKRFHLGANHRSLGGGLSNWWRRRRREQPSAYDTSANFWALHNVSFSVASGDALGIIGPNGAGKSTALKLLARILTPDRGSIRVQGRTAALIEVGAGFHGDLTGRENIYLNGTILGMSRPEIRSKLDNIVSFAGLERFLDMPVKRYSSGMYARLGFSIAVHVDPDVLLVDEVLSVGDAMFRLRCMERMRQLTEDGTTLVFVTHDLDQMNAVCKRVLVLDRGVTVFDGDAREAAAQYIGAMSRSQAPRGTDVEGDADRRNNVEVVSVRFLNPAGQEIVWVTPHQPVRLSVTLRFHKKIPRYILELNMRGALGNNLLSINSGRDEVTLAGQLGEQTIELALADLPVGGGQYFWNIRLWDADVGQTEIDSPFQFPLMVDDRGRATGALALDHDWILPRREKNAHLTPHRPVTCGAHDRLEASHEDMPS